MSALMMRKLPPFLITSIHCLTRVVALWDLTSNLFLIVLSSLLRPSFLPASFLVEWLESTARLVVSL